jgi:hypothetical protein
MDQKAVLGPPDRFQQQQDFCELIRQLSPIKGETSREDPDTIVREATCVKSVPSCFCWKRRLRNLKSQQ